MECFYEFTSVLVQCVSASWLFLLIFAAINVHLNYVIWQEALFPMIRVTLSLIREVFSMNLTIEAFDRLMHKMMTQQFPAVLHVLKHQWRAVMSDSLFTYYASLYLLGMLHQAYGVFVVLQSQGFASFAMCMKS